MARARSFSIYRGGRVFVLPLINRFSTMDLTPQTNTVVVESAIAKGIVPADGQGHRQLRRLPFRAWHDQCRQAHPVPDQ